uniref:Replicase n=1 Tax=Cytorhabdovirus fragariae TaxID=2676436 RepID=A0A650AD40_9RHAB|nr:putative L protein [Cytorhabdovirus fragariae]
MDFREKLEDDISDTQAIVSETSLADYHLRNPLKEITWWDKERLPARLYKDRLKIREIFGDRITLGHPSSLHGLTSARLPNMDMRQMECALGDLALRMLMDNGILPRESRAPIKKVLNAAREVPRMYWNGMRFWGRALLDLNANASNRKKPAGEMTIPSVLKFDDNRDKIYIFRTCSVLSLRSETPPLHILIDGDWMRMLSDLYTQRWLVRCGAAIGRCFNPEHYPPAEVIERVYQWGDSVIADLGNTGYKVIKTFEPLMIGYIQCGGEGSMVPSDRFLRNTMKDLREADVRFSTHANGLLQCVAGITNRHHLVQLYGLHRSWGHPTVDSRAGMEKLMKIGKKDIIKDNKLSVNAGRMFKLLFCKEYRSKFGTYPRIVESGTLLSTEILENDPSAVMKGSHDLEAWDRIRFQRTYKLPETFNLSMIVADKAISPTRSELVRIIETKGTVMDSDLRRGVKRWLNDRSLNAIEFLENINDGIFPKDHLIIGLTPKERELNSVPRMFSLMSHLLRVYVVVTEQLLSDHILEMFPQITMTDTLLDLTRKMYSTVKNQSSLKKNMSKERGWASRTVCISLDFEKWNGHMRKEMTQGVFTAVGELFGLPELYNMTYDLFSKCYYYLADGSYVPAVSEDKELIVEEPLSFENHRGGMEGLRQKGWTLYTVCGLEVILSKYDCEYKIMGMGDNQVLQITVYTKFTDHTGKASEAGVRQMAVTLQKIFSDLVESFTASGLPLKPLETWMSEDLYLYGKVPIWKGVPLTMDLKKLMRTFAMSNEGIMTLENSLSTVSSNALAATQASPCIWPAYVIYVMMTSLCIEDYLDYHPILGRGMLQEKETWRKNDTWVLKSRTSSNIYYQLQPESWKLGREKLRLLISMIPKSINGYCGANIYEMMVRGFSDRLSRDLSYINNIRLSSATPSWIVEYLDRWISPIYMPEKNYSLLLEDVCAVNLISPRSPLAGVRQVVARYLSGGMRIENPEFMQLVRAKGDEDSRYLAECLCENDELHVRLLHDVFDATVYGYVDSILSKVTKTTTIQKLAIQSDSVRVFETIESDETNYFKFFRWRCFAEGDPLVSNCATTQCKVMREKGWGKKIRGVTTPFPLSYLIETDCGRQGVCDCQDGYLSIHYPDKQLPNDMWNEDIGGNPPYLGSMTKEKVVVGSGGKIYSAEPLIRRPVNLLRTINWFVPPDSNMAKVIEKCASSVTDLGIERFKGMVEGTAGTEAHRYQDSSTFRGALSSSNFLFSTRCHISTDNLTRYSKGAENTDFHYQAAFCVLLELSNMYITNKLREDDVICRFKHFKQCCYECIHPVEDDFIDLPNAKAVNVIPSYVDNEYLYTSSSKIRILERISPLYDRTADVVTSEEYDKMGVAEKSRLLHRTIADRIIKDIMKGRGTDTHVTVGLTSVKSYERTMYFKLDPKVMIDTVMSGLREICGWTVLRSHPERTKPSPSEISRVLINCLNSADTHCFLGLGMFYCWEETTRRFSRAYAEIVPPSTNPVSVSSACEAIRCSLLSLAHRDLSIGLSRSTIILHDEKNETLIYKILLCEQIKRQTKCVSCIAETCRLETGDLWRDFRLLSCHYGHRTADWIPVAPWRKSYITVERLRKDCCSSSWEDRMPALRLKGCTPENNFLVRLIGSHQIRFRGEAVDYQEPQDQLEEISSGITLFHLAALGTMPTSTIYKMQDIIGGMGISLQNKICLCLGDGLGSSSTVLRSMGCASVVSSTMIEPDEAIPHSYAHNVLPVPQVYGMTGIEYTKSIHRHNDIRNANWERDWHEELSSADVVYSDAEIVNPDEHRTRYEVLSKILLSGKREITIVKDYIWSVEELANKIGVVHSCGSSQWSLVTTRFRSHHYPEVWWIVRDSNPKRGRVPVSPIASNILNIWENIKKDLSDNLAGYVLTAEENHRIAMMTPSIITEKMISYVRAWATFQMVGNLLPSGGTFTHVYYYILKTKRPPTVKQSDGPDKKLYLSDYLELRSKLFAIAVSMIAPIDLRLSTIKESHKWGLTWENYGSQWEVKLVRSEETKEPECDVIKYIPTLSILMKQQGLLFERIGSTVSFGINRKRDEVYFPVTQLSLTLRRSQTGNVKTNREGSQRKGQEYR